MEKGIVRRWLWLAVCASFWGTACQQPDKPTVKTPEPVLPSVPRIKLTASPTPGAYTGYTLNVTITADDPAAELYYSLISSPTAQGNGFHKKITVKLLHSGVISVIARSPEGGEGQATFEYRLLSKHPDGDCDVQPFPKAYYRADEDILAQVQYTMPTALATLELIVDGVTRQVIPGEYIGVENFNIGKLTSNGAHTVGCRVRESAYDVVEGNTVSLAVDASVPVVTWLKSGGVFTRENWDGIFILQVEDGETGVEGVQLCGAGVDACHPLESVGGDQYVFATAVTPGTTGLWELSVIASDLAGNVALAPDLTLDFTNFDEPQAPPALAIPVTVAASINLASVLGTAIPARDVIEVAAIGLASYYTPSAVPLEAGWNDFLFRQAGRTEWESFSIYGAGARITLPARPATTLWLVYASRSRVPLFAGEKMGEVAGSLAGSTWQSDAFEIPHLWFVEDVNGNHVWDSFEPVFMVTGDSFLTPWLGLASPVDKGTSAVPFYSLPGTAAVEIDCRPGGCVTPGTLIFSSRVASNTEQFPWEKYGAPLNHIAYAINSFPALITVPTSNNVDCFFHWDASGDGELNPLELRDRGPCGAGSTFILDSQAGILDVQPVSFSTFTYESLTGVPYGSQVTGSLTLLASDVSALLSVPLVPLKDDDGLGALMMQVPVTFYVPARLHFGSTSGESVWEDLPVFTAPTANRTLFWVSVSDETGTPREAIIKTGPAALPMELQAVYDLMAAGNLTLADGGGAVAVYAPPGDATPDFIAVRSGYLGVLASDVTMPSVALRLLSPAVTGWLSGSVADDLGQPIPNASLRWRSAQYASQTVSNENGVYALPASGGVGTLDVLLPGRQGGELAYALVVTREAVSFDIVVPLAPAWTEASLWPEGLGGASGLPFFYGSYTAPLLLREDLVYSAPLTTGAWTGGFYADLLFRDFSMPGALPASPIIQGDVFTVNGNLASYDTEARCGAYHQRIAGSGIIDSACWSWTATDGPETYYLGRLSPVTGFPAYSGLREIGGTLRTSSYYPAPDQTLLLKDRLIGRTIRVPVSGGSFLALIPAGRYDVVTSDGVAVLAEQGGPAMLFTGSAAPVLWSFYLP